jgi:hypothetical protein
MKWNCVSLILLLIPGLIFAQGVIQVSGTVVDISGAVIPGATAQVRTTNGTVEVTMQSDTSGCFVILGLPAGDYRLIVSSPGFESKEMPIKIGTSEAPVALRISMVVSSVSTTVNVQGQEDSLIGIADSASQGTVGATEIQDRPILRSVRSFGDGSGRHDHATCWRRQGQPIFSSRL